MSRFLQYLKSFWRDLRTKNSFLQNSAWLFSASALSTLIQFLFFPILSRIYEPEAYGVFGLFNAIVANIAIVAGLNLSRAFVLPKSNDEFRALVQVCFRSILLISGVTLIVSLLAGKQLLQLFNAGELGAWIYLAGPAVLLIAVDKALVDWAVRIKAFKKFAVYNVQTALASKLFNVAYGLKISNGASGLILTHLLNLGLRVGIYYRLILGKDRGLIFRGSNATERKAALQEYRNFPLFLLPGNFLNSVSNQLAILMLPLFGMNMAAVGIYSFSLIALDLPVKLLSSAFGPVFLQKSTDVHHHEPEKLGIITWRLYVNLSVVSLLPVAVLFIAGGPLYSIAFGSNWEEAGLVAEVLALSYYFRINSSPISSVLSVIRKERHILYFQILLFVFRLLALFLGYLSDQDLIGYMIIYSIFNGVAYLVLGIWVFALIRFPLWRVILFNALSFGILITLSWTIKSLLFL